MHIIDKGPSYPLQERFALGNAFEIDGEICVNIQIDKPAWYHLERCKTESDDQIIEMEEVNE